MKYLIACLGNIGAEYDETRHNIGFKIADRLAKDLDASFTTGRLAQTAEMKFKGKTLLVIKPTTYMNLSGKAVKYWLQQEKIPIENLLVVNDDIALPLGALRLKKQGADGGHNGLKNIAELLGSQEYARIRLGIGNEYARGEQVDFVLVKLSEDQLKQMEEISVKVIEGVKLFVTDGVSRAMNTVNTKTRQ